MDSVAGSWRLHLKKTDLPDAAPCVYVVDEEGRLRGSVPLVRLALADPAVRLREILEPVDYHLVRDTPVLTVLRCMDDGAWDELPVVDSEGRYWEAVFRKPLLMNLLIGGISAGEALPGFLESRWAQVGIEWLM
jgi:CBS domain-containing protein